MAKIKCNHCGDILTGDKKGTYIPCSCGKCAIDETPYYYRIIGNFEDYEVIEPKEENKATIELYSEKGLSNNEKYNKIFNYFGYENQRRKMNEEMQELNDAILLYETGNGDINNVIEEIGDLFNVINGFMEFYEITHDEVENIMKHKLDRTIERINSGYYGSRKSN